MESAGPGVWVGTPVPTDCSPVAMVAPLGPPPASALPENSSLGLVKQGRKQPFERFYFQKIKILTYMNMIILLLH